MFGINSFEQVGQIVEGWTKDIVKMEQELHDDRMKICRECPLFDTSSILGPVCSSKKCYDPETKEVFLYPKSGAICGCGCAMEKASRVKNKKCVLGKW